MVAVLRPAHARQRIRAHLETCRPYTLFYPGLVGLAGAGTTGQPLPAVLGPTFAWLGAHYLGDYLDRDLDASAKPQRPIPSGRLSPGSAALSAVACLTGFWVIALTTNVLLALPTAGITAGVVLYSAVLKARGLAGNLVRGSLTALAYAFGALTSGYLGPNLIFAAVFFAHDTGSNLIGTLRDIDGDRTCGYRTFPVKRGADATLHMCILLFAFAILTAAVAGHTDRAAPVLYPVLLTCSCCLLVHALDIIAHAPRPVPQLAALKAHGVLVVERIIITAAALSLAYAPLTTIAVLVPAVAISALLQKAMRQNHEIP